MCIMQMSVVQFKVEFRIHPYSKDNFRKSTDAVCLQFLKENINDICKFNVQNNPIACNF